MQPRRWKTQLGKARSQPKTLNYKRTTSLICELMSVNGELVSVCCELVSFIISTTKHSYKHCCHIHGNFHPHE
jgi:hypothetical protein